MSWIPSYKDPDYEPPYIPCSWSTGTDAEIVEALQKHYDGKVDLTEYWAIGDTRTISLSAMTGVLQSHAAQDVTFVLSHVGGKYLSDGVTECAFQIDQIYGLDESDVMNNSNTNTGGWKGSEMRTWCNNAYKNAIPSTIRSIFKEFINQSGLGGGSSSGVENTTDTFALRAVIEVLGTKGYYAVDGEGSQVDWYKTSINRGKSKTMSDSNWWTRSPGKDNSAYFNYIIWQNNGPIYSNWMMAYTTLYISPFGVI